MNYENPDSESTDNQDEIADDEKVAKISENRPNITTTSEIPQNPNENQDGVDGPRVSSMKAAQKEWVSRLVDMTARNRLMFYKDLKVGTMDLSPDSNANQQAIQQLLQKNKISLDLLFPEKLLQDSIKRARAINHKAVENFEERGLGTLYLAAGMATWSTQRSMKSIPASPVLLRPARLIPKGRADANFEIEIEDEWEVNPTLLYVLKKDFDIEVNGDELIELLERDEGSGTDTSEMFSRLTKEASRITGFEIYPRIVLGNFSYAKLEMVKDLDSNFDVLVNSDMLCAIAGYKPAIQAIRDRQHILGDSVLDRIHPENEFLIIDADSSQSHVINAAIAGNDLVVKGPPGTGKSQTIANVIASLAAHGKKVLFVAEKRAAIDAVVKKLTDSGLADILLDLHAGTKSKKQIAKELSKSLSGASNIGIIDVTGIHKNLVKYRTKLINYNNSLHENRSPWNISLYEAQSRLLGIPQHLRSRDRLSRQTLAGLNSDKFEELEEKLYEFVELGGLKLSTGTSPWSSALETGSIATDAQVRKVRETSSSLWVDTWPLTIEQLNQLIFECGFKQPANIGVWTKIFALLDQISETLQNFEPSVFELPLDELAIALAPAANARSRIFAGIFNGQYRQAKKTIRHHAKPGVKISAQRLLVLANNAQSQIQNWAKLGPSEQTPMLPSNLRDVEHTYHVLSEKLKVLGAFLGASHLSQAPINSLSTQLKELNDDTETLFKLPRLVALRRDLYYAGIGFVIEQMGDIAPKEAIVFLQSTWLASIIEEININDPHITSFSGITADTDVNEFKNADTTHISTNSLRVKRAVAERITAVRDKFPEQSHVVEKQSVLQRRLMPMRELYLSAPDVLGALKPCWVMSPLAVSQLLPMKECFDVAIFDEASQVTPEDAAAVIARAKRVIVAGDEHQLPPTKFFSSSEDEIETDSSDENEIDTSLISDVESVLDQMAALLPPPIGTRNLQWHYRSQDERLIAFSNAQKSLYDHSMTTFPGTGIEDPIRHELVPWREGMIGQEDSTSNEVRKVVELITEHAHTRPDESLGVIAMGIKHATRIEEACRLARLKDDILEAFAAKQSFSSSNDEKLFIKNLERVQGDERDAIILSIGYTKSADGRMLYNFGPITQQGGERRLNVAFTRAKKRVTLVSSFGSHDLDPNKLRSEGSQMLGRYITYAESGGTNLGEFAITQPELNPFELDVQSELTKAGIPLIPQWGSSGYWIDFVAQHSKMPGRMVLAIECDGKTYHSSPTARDRDRLRQEHLERLGWRFHRIWSTEWFRHREQEILRAVSAYEAALASSDHSHMANLKTQREDTAEIVIKPGTTERKTPFPIQPGLGVISAYTPAELVKLIRWIQSDSLLRTESELIEESIRLLGFRRKTKNIVSALEKAIGDSKKGQKRPQE